jgi:hypothetical protein
MKKNWVRNIIRGLSLTSVLFVFQACYGTPQDLGLDMLIEGQVTSKTSGTPIKGIRVTIADNMQYVITGEDGQFSFYTAMLKDLTLQFQDADINQDGCYITKDTVLTDVSDQIYLDIKLEERK